jgi:hypothetical protein
MYIDNSNIQKIQQGFGCFAWGKQAKRDGDIAIKVKKKHFREMKKYPGNYQIAPGAKITLVTDTILTL